MLRRRYKLSHHPRTSRVRRGAALVQSPTAPPSANTLLLSGCRSVWYRSLLRPLLFRVDPESAHERTAALMRRAAAVPGAAAALAALFEYRSPRLACRQWGIDFANPIGLAAGFDKTGELYPFLTAAGFGFVE